MINKQYIGARYVPQFADPIEWNAEAVYNEAMTIVTYLNSSYTSRKPVPRGTLPTNSEYWALTGNYNAQVEEYRKEVEQVKIDVEEVKPLVPEVAELNGNVDQLGKSLTDVEVNVLENTADIATNTAAIEQLEKGGSPIDGKLICIIGDSNVEEGRGFKGLVDQLREKYPTTEFINRSTGACGFYWGGSENYLNKFTQIQTDLAGRKPDYFLIWAGHNDLNLLSDPTGYNNYWGEVHSKNFATEPESALGNMNNLLGKIRIAYPECKIKVVIRGIKKTSARINGDTWCLSCFKKVCDKWSVPFIDLQKCSNITENATSQAGQMMYDDSHYNELGFKTFVVPVVSDFLEREYTQTCDDIRNIVIDTWDTSTATAMNLGLNKIANQLINIDSNLNMTNYNLNVITLDSTPDRNIIYTGQYFTGESLEALRIIVITRTTVIMYTKDDPTTSVWSQVSLT